jgi:nitronate monooxygenase
LATRDGDPIVRYQTTAPHASVLGDIEAQPLWAGQSVGLVRDVAPAAAIVRRIAAEAKAALDRAAATITT